MRKSAIKIIDDKGRISIPKELREFSSILTGDVVKLIASPQGLVLRKVGINDLTSNDEKDIEATIHNAFNALSVKRQIAIVKSVIETLERNQNND